MAVSRSPRDVLSVIGLGSCVALILIAPQKRSAGLAHIVLPEVKDGWRARSAAGQIRRHRSFGAGSSDARFSSAQRGRLRDPRGRRDDVRAQTRQQACRRRRSQRRIDRAALAAEGIGIASEDIGGDSGRSVQVVVADLQVFVRSGTTEPFEMRGSAKPIAVKVPTVGADPSLEPFPGDIWTADPPDRQVAS